MDKETTPLNNYFCLEDDMSSLEKFLHLGKRKFFAKGSKIFPNDKQIDHLYYLKTGKAGRLLVAANGMEKYIKIVCDQSILGEVLFFTRKTSTTAQRFIAIEDCECFLFDEQTVYQILLKDEQVIRDLVNWFCRRMSSLSEQVVDAMIKDPYYRVAKFLYMYICEFGKVDHAGQHIFEGKLSHYDIAKYLGMNRVSVTTVLKQLQEEGIIEKDRTRLIILDMDYLAQL